MADPEHYFIVYHGREAIEDWQRRNPNRMLDLEGANLRDLDLSGADLTCAKMRGALLTRTKLTGANLDRATLDNCNLIGAALDDATLTRARLRCANLTGAILQRANCREADMHCTTLSHAILTGANLFGANLRHTNFVDGGVDAYGDDYRATWAEGGGSLEIRNQSEMWTSFEDALAAYGDDCKRYINRPEIRLRLTYMRDQYWLRIKQSEGGQ